MPILIFSPVQIIMGHPIYKLFSKFFAQNTNIQILNFALSGYKRPGQKGYLDQWGQHLPPAYTPHLPEHYLKVDPGHNHPGYY
jgi:hypothetical protein